MGKKAFYVLKDFEENLKTNTKGKNYVAKCPECGKWNLYISKKTGLYNCFTGGCGFKGILQDFLPEKPLTDASTASGCFYPKRGKLRFVPSHALQHPPGPLQKGDGGVRMLPTDYKRLKPEVKEAIKPVKEHTETADLDEQAAQYYQKAMLAAVKNGDTVVNLVEDKENEKEEGGEDLTD